MYVCMYVYTHTRIQMYILAILPLYRSSYLWLRDVHDMEQKERESERERERGVTVRKLQAQGDIDELARTLSKGPVLLAVVKTS